MTNYTPLEYIKIAIANAYGLDKELFETRINWVDTNIDNLNTHVQDADEPAIFMSGVMALDDALGGRPTGFMMGLDSCSSGVQIMGALIGCRTTCENTGLVDPNVRADLYGTTTGVMNTLLSSQGITVNVPRDDAKQSVMTHFYGSQAKPLEIFGEDTPEYFAFYEALDVVAPGAGLVMGHLLSAWQPYALEHSWLMPDGFEVVIPVVEAVDFKVEVDELAHATFTHRIYENQGTKTGLSIAANVVHSVDGMVVREMNRRCNYDEGILRTIAIDLKLYLGTKVYSGNCTDFVSLRLAEQLYNRDVTFHDTDTDKLFHLLDLINQVLEHVQFPLVCVHDEFKCSPNNMNQLRKHYIGILSELSKSNLLTDILAQLHGVSKYNLPKLGNVSQNIYNSNYALS